LIGIPPRRFRPSENRPFSFTANVLIGALLLLS
jgi:hypothetical protein